MGVVDDAVASGGFGFVEGFVGAAHHVLHAHVREIHPDDAEAGSYADGLVAIGEGLVRDGLLQLNEPR